MSEFRFGAIQLSRQRVTATGNNLYVNGQLVGTGIFALDSDLYSTGISLLTSINALSGYADAISGVLQSQIDGSNVREFVTGLETGFSQYLIGFNPSFSSVPKVVIAVETTGDYLYMANVKERTISGFTASMSDIVYDEGISLNVMASVS